ncbi:hypothetical protein [Streptomyces sp. NPDC052701]|uniref:hypothetical protein n=1 Tax=Streptomyces sp. NPDC052701 TaxID=3155533 RepID=UPI0034213C4A
MAVSAARDRRASKPAKLLPGPARHREPGQVPVSVGVGPIDGPDATDDSLLFTKRP